MKPEEEVIFVDGANDEMPMVTIKIDKLTKGEYYFLYRPDFKPQHSCRKINIVFTSKFAEKRSAGNQIQSAQQI